MFFYPKNLKSETDNPWFKPWFIILLHTQLCVPQKIVSVYLGYITLAIGKAFWPFCPPKRFMSLRHETDSMAWKILLQKCLHKIVFLFYCSKMHSTIKLNRMWTRYTSLLSRKTELMKKQSVRESNSKLTAFPVKMPH